MSVIIGGSGSTGSSLLKNLLNNHPMLFSGIETNLFVKKALYGNWNSNKNRLLKRGWRGLPNYSWHYLRGVDLLHADFGWERNELEEVAVSSSSFPEFANAFFQKPLKLTGAHQWIEKTPANSACFRFFLREFKGGKIIHMTRNPYDTVRSLTGRGYTLYYAVGIYLLNTSAALALKDHPQSLTVKYEDLVSDPETELRKVCRFLEVRYDEQMLKPSGGEANFETRLKGWKYDEMEEVKKGSVGRFFEMPTEEQFAISAALNMTLINNHGKKLCNNQIENIRQICRRLGYDYLEPPKGDTRALYNLLSQQRRKNLIFRMSKACSKAIWHPLSLVKPV